jgi:chitin disaccharide deacetylase
MLLRSRRLLLVGALIAPARTLTAQATAVPEVLLRLDDIGVTHAVNQAVEKVAATGMPISVSVLFACPWYQEAVEILKKYPNVTVGVHLALNSEWRGYRWGPVLGRTAVPSLVDSVGYFHPSSKAFRESKYDLAEVERELTAQMDRAIRSGLKIAYADPHMGSALATPQLQEVTERVARKYGVGISGYFGENYRSIWGVPPATKTSQFIAYLDTSKPNQPNLIEVHVAERTPEMEAIMDMNATEQNKPGAGVVHHRKAELEAMLSPELAARVKSGRIRLINYQQLMARLGGPSAMRRPAPRDTITP